MGRGDFDLLLLPDRTAELRRIHVSAARGQGIGTVLVYRLEQAARENDVCLPRFDTRSDLAEARRLHTRLRFCEVELFNTSQQPGVGPPVGVVVGDPGAEHVAHRRPGCWSGHHLTRATEPRA